jgi:hypothetical protein
MSTAAQTTDVASWVKSFRRSVDRPAREEILRQQQRLDDIVVQIAAVPESHRSALLQRTVAPRG